MGWKIIEVENSDNLNLFLDNLIISKENTKIKIPINDIDVLILNNYKLKITIQLINALANNNVLIIICDNKQLPSANILPIIGNYNTLKILENQINWTRSEKAYFWKKIIKSKINNQINFLKQLNLEVYQDLIHLYNEVKDYDISNREGHASKIYWHALFGKGFKRHEDDYINSLLNYGYTILRSYMTRSIIKKGLDPRVSIYHKSFHNYFALSSDLMEPFRVIIDGIVYTIINSKEDIKFYDAKEIIIKSFNTKILINNKFQFINNAIDIFIDSIINSKEILEIKYQYAPL